MVTVLHTLSGVSFSASQYVLATLRAIIFGAMTVNRALPTSSNSGSDPADWARDFAKRIPLDLRTAIDVLGLEPDIVSYACCPKCFATYKPHGSKPDDPYPRKCTRMEDGDSRCNKRLVRAVGIKPVRQGDPVRTVYRPVKTYVFRRFQSWLADLLGRPGIEAAIQESWTRQPDAAQCTDIMDSPTIRQFVGPDGKTLFSVQAHGSVHLVFSLFVDWFNPYGNKKAGKSHSIGAIYLACLNLPPHLRYRPENIYLAGIIPGPKEPSLEQLNELLRPLVDELLALWNPGIYLLKTAMKPAGRVVRAALIPLVCDLPALRKTAGFASHSSRHFCSFCPLTLDKINNVERSTWPRPRTWSTHLDIAQQWKEAPTEGARNSVFADHGIRWSELLRLPYWDPTRFAVLDVMHNLFLGEVHHHCRRLWGVDVAQDKQPAASKAAEHTPAQQQAYLDKVFAATCAGSQKTLANIRKDYTSAVGRFNNILGQTSSELTRLEIASALLDWVSASSAHTY